MLTLNLQSVNRKFDPVHFSTYILCACTLMHASNIHIIFPGLLTMIYQKEDSYECYIPIQQNSNLARFSEMVKLQL